jgi:lysophospholipase L1-like esterase
MKRQTVLASVSSYKHYLAVSLVALALVCPGRGQAEEESTAPASVLVDVNGDGQINIAAFGDSITRGVGDSIPVGAYITDHPDHPSGEAGYPVRIEQYLHIPVTNLGYSGEAVTEGGVYRFAANVPSLNADIIVIAEGTNDTIIQAYTVEYYRDIQAMINIARASGKVPVLATIPPTCCSHASMNPWIDQFNGILRELAVINEITLADVNHAYSNTCYIGECYLLNLPEGVHPNNAGYGVYGEVVMASLLQIPLFAPDGAALLEAALGLPAGSVQTKPDPVAAAPAS